MSLALPRAVRDAAAPSPATLGMWVFVASEVLFFGALLFAYGVARWHAPAAFAAASARTNFAIGTSNTAVLLSSSALVALASERLHDAAPRAAARCLAGAALLGIVFIALKGFEWRAEWSAGLFPGPGWTLAGRREPAAELFFAWYFVSTGLHAVHLGVGIVLALLFVRRLRRPLPAPAAEAERVHAFGLYWHFVDVVWILLYPLIYLVAPRS